jgi:hypothetical protein
MENYHKSPSQLTPPHSTIKKNIFLNNKKLAIKNIKTCNKNFPCFFLSLVKCWEKLLSCENSISKNYYFSRTRIKIFLDVS